MGKKSELTAARTAAAIERNQQLVSHLFDAEKVNFPCPDCESRARRKVPMTSTEARVVDEFVAWFPERQRNDPRAYCAYCECGRVSVIVPEMEQRKGAILVAVERARVKGELFNSFHLVERV